MGIEINVVDIDASIKLIKKYVTDIDTSVVIGALEAIKSAPEDEALIVQLKESLSALGTRQGAVLTYAPYLISILSDDPFDEKKYI